ncbi:HXXXD-type acyl-transferase family protein [Perilla frutescens var. hirtella]|nr:HXXXD-type acyl-transferase family protein [Perilla frutescens var. frutescens]KAH6776024.1 HXXXD-type acyl-transferase family protein [Perilla frutescens var. hirtella]
MCLKKDFEVKVCKSEVVAAALPMQEHWLPLSNLDMLLPPVDFGVFFCYTHDEPFAQIVAVLKKALAQTLVSYYAFAGVLVKNSAGEPELLCNNSGVDFVEAVSDVGLEELNLYNPDESVGGKLVPLRKRGVLAVQVTQLKRGGMVVACTVAHQVADAYSANMFLVSWAETARSKKLSLPPSFRRSLLLPRRPGSYDISVDNMYVTLSALPPPPSDKPEDDGDGAISRIYYVKSDQIRELQELANTGNSKENRRSKLEAFCAFLWKMVVSGKDSGGENNCKLGIVVDGRSRLIDGDEKRAKLIAPYFGNVLSIPFGEKKIGVLKEKSLNWVANEVHEFLHCAATKEHFVGLIDWVEEHRPEMALAKIYAARVTEEEPAVVVSSGQQFPARKIDFGWGLPVFGSYHFPWGGKSGYVMPMPSVKGNGDWIVYMHLLKGQLELIETNAAHVFNPLTFDYVFSMI